MTTMSWSRRETVWFTLAALGFIVVEIAAMGAWAMVTKPFTTVYLLLRSSQDP